MGTAKVTLDDAAFASEESGSRVQQRGQRVIHGTMAGSATYASNGESADLSNYFPAGNYRVILNPVSNTGNRIGVYDHTNKKLLIYSALTTEVGVTDQSVNGVFSFIAIGE
jgi:hypothetical protein